MKAMSRYLLLSPILCFLACGAEKPPPSENYLSLTDGIGKRITLQKRPEKLLSLAASMTEIIAFVCDTSTITGISHTCNYPTSILNKPRVNTYPLDFEKIVQLNPDLILTIDGMTSADDIKRLEDLGFVVLTQKYLTVNDVFEGMTEIGEITGFRELASLVVDSLKERLSETYLPADGDLPNILCITWHDPIYVWGHNTIMTDKLRLAGGKNAITEVFEAPYPAIGREYILQLNPDVIFGGDFERMDSTFFTLYPELRKTKAYINRKVFATNDDLTTRPGPRIVESIEEYRRLLSSE